jgi:hypothetical protein
MVRREAFAMGHAVAQLVESLRYKPKGRGLEFFIDRILGSILTEMSTRTVSSGAKACNRPVRRLLYILTSCLKLVLTAGP